LSAINAACAAFARRGWRFELVVCDNNSTDRTAEIARAAGARVTFEPINQISRARNSGAAAACGDWLIFVDADSFPSENLFARAAEEICSGKCAGGGCLVQLDEDTSAGRFVVGLWNLLSRVMKWPAGSFICCEANLFHQVGGFSTKLYASEELDFARRLKKAARASCRRLVIITDERLVTSARKMRLYSRREHFRFFFKALLRPRMVTARREECLLWYDGRR
jgi:glycosyltransferase involved in cell wall biosynthesis